MFTAMNYLGGVTDATRTKTAEVLDALEAARGTTLTHTWGKGGGSEHSTGRAVDFMVFGDRAAGDYIADYLIANRVRLGVAWLIWQQQMFNVNPGKYGPGLQWNPMEDRGNGTQNHRDHVHVLFGRDSLADAVPSIPAASAAPPQPTGQAAPPFPLPGGWYFGPRSGPDSSVSGYHGRGDGLAQWQAQMQARGWTIAADGLYGPRTAAVARAFQAEKGLGVDGLIGPDTWRAAWEAAVTS